MTSTAARRIPIQTLLSGPVGGTIGGRALSEALDRPNLLCVDMGGTSFDVSLIVDGHLSVSTETALEGLPVLMSIVDIHTIGAGGGSLAWLEAGALRVGPRSAERRPDRPVTDRGNQPTVTDANLARPAQPRLLPRRRDDARSQCASSGDPNRRRAAWASTTRRWRKGCSPSSTPRWPTRCAHHYPARHRPSRLPRRLRRGRADARRRPGRRARHLRGDRPRAPGTFSAWGMLQSDIRHDMARTFYAPLADTTPETIEAIFSELEEQGREVLRGRGAGREDGVSSAPPTCAMWGKSTLSTWSSRTTSRFPNTRSPR